MSATPSTPPGTASSASWGVPSNPVAAPTWQTAPPPQPPATPAWGSVAPGYPTPPTYATPPVRPQNGMGIAGLVLGIISLLLFGFILGILAIIFSSIGIQRANNGQATNKTMAIWGLVLGIIGFVGWMIFILA